MCNNKIFFKFSELSFLEKHIYYKTVFKFLRRLAWEYPNFTQWYDNLFIKDAELRPEREIIICESDLAIVGVAILKSNEVEKKICTLRVDKKYQRQGIGKQLMGLSLEWLESDYPVLTMHKVKQYEFDPLLKYFGFKLEQKQYHYYNIFSTELVYNGVLPEKDIFFSKLELLDMQDIYRKFIESGKYNFEQFLEECISKWYLRESKRRMIMQIY